MEIFAEIAALVGTKKLEILSEIKDIIKDTVVDEGKKFAVDFDIAFTKYLKAAYEKYSKVKTLLYKNEPRYLYDFFVCNNVELHRKTIDCSSVNALLEQSHFNIIWGSGGTGKSILMRHFFINAIEKKNLIPLFLELRTYTGGQIEKCLYTSLNNLGFSLEEKYFYYALKSGAFLILLDGYDEIADNKKLEFYQELEQFCDRYSKNWYIISSRQSDSFAGWQRFTLFQIEPLTKEQARSLVKKLDYDKDTKEKFLQDLDTLYEKHESFMSNPLLLNIMLMTYDNFAEIPEKRHVFYSNAFDALYAMHDATKGGFKRDLKSNLSSDIFKKIFADFCFISYLKGKIEFSLDDLYEILTCGKKYKSDFDIEFYIRDLQEAVCLIYKDGNTYLFTHRSFQEYFTALYLRNLNDDQQQQACRHLLDIRNLSIDSDSVLEMLMDMNQDRFESNFMIPVLKEMESVLPNGGEDELQKRFVGYIDAIEILTRKSLLEETQKEIIDWNYLCVVHTQKSVYFLAAKFKESSYSCILNFIFTHYCKQEFVYKRQKILTSYLERPYSTEEVLKDKALFEKIMQTRLWQLLKASIGLLAEMENRRQSNRNEFLKLLESYR